MNSINFEHEHRLLSHLVNVGWMSPCPQTLQRLVTFIFNEGLSASQTWIDPFVSFSMQAASHDQNQPALIQRAFSLFDAELYKALMTLDKSSFSQSNAKHYASVEAIKRKVESEFGEAFLSKLEVKLLDGATYEREYVNFSGLKSANTFRMMNVNIALSYDEVMYMLQDRGRSQLVQFINGIYSHALACGYEHNRQEMSALIKDVYGSIRENPPLTNIYHVILDKCREHLIFHMLESVYSFSDFLSHDSRELPSCSEMSESEMFELHSRIEQSMDHESDDSQDEIIKIDSALNQALKSMPKHTVK
jgi:hypothetical protein